MTRIYNYYPYGTLRLDEGSTTTSFTQSNQFIGQNRDAEADLSYLNARYYSSNNGQFTSQDPVFWEVGQSRDGLVALYKPQLQNSYSYAADSPIVNKDPDGRFLDTIVDLGFIAYDIYSIGSAYANGQDVREQVAYLGLDIAGALTPFATGFGAVARTAKVAEKAEDKYSVYEFYDDKGSVVYTGITKQKPEKRWAQHTVKDPSRADLNKSVVQTGMTKTEARLFEQASIEAYGGTGGGQLLNRNNSIGSNTKLYKSSASSISSASKHIQNGNYDKALKELQKASKQLSKIKK